MPPLQPSCADRNATRRTSLPLVESLARDVRFACRALRRDATVATFAILIAGLGIGASTTVFSIVQALLFRPLPFAEPDRLVWIANGDSENLSAQTVQVSNLLELTEQSRSYTGIAGFYPFYAPGDIRLTGATGEPERLTGVPITQQFFPLLGITPLVGRTFDADESQWNAPRTVVLGHAFWERRFAADRQIVGRTIILDGAPSTVIGVLPPSFDFAAIFTPGRRVDLFLPYPLSPETNRKGNTLALIGRLRDGVQIEAARNEARSIGRRIVTGNVGGVSRNKLDPRVSPLRERISGRFQPALLALIGAVGFLMLLVCANLSNLLLVRASIRQREMAVRAALGATRAHVMRQMLVESLLLSIGGALLGLALAIGGTRLVAQLQGTTLPLLSDVQVDGVVLGFTVLVALATGIGFGMLPALQASGIPLTTVLADGSRGSTGGRSGWVRRSIVVTEIALACVLLTGAGLLTRSLTRVLDTDLGFASENLLAIRVDPHRSGTTLAQRNAYFDDVVRSVSAVPGVERLGLTDALPLGDNFGWRRWGASASEQPRGDYQGPQPLVRMIDEAYLGAMRIPLRAGRAFTAADDSASEPVIIVNETLATVMWPGTDPIGKVVHTSGKTRRVVGVVGSVRYFALDRDVDAEMYLPLRQTGDYQSVDLVIRSAMAPTSIAASVRAVLKRVDPSLPVVEFRTMEQLVDRSLFARRFVVLLVTGFAAFGLLLSALGIYAVISYSVNQRTQEMGIRMALGATPRDVRAHVLGETGTLVVAGLACGLPLSWMAARAISGLLFDVGASDPTTFVATLAILSTVAALAGYVPARRATRVDPAIALRPR
jgi:predicted permease